MNERKREAEGVAFVLVGMVLWGLFPIFTKLGVSGMTPILFGAVTALVASVPLVGTALAQRAVPAAGDRRMWRDLAFIAVMGTVIPVSLFFTGTAMTSGINAGILQQMEPIYSLLLSYFVLREAVPGRQLLGGALLLAGAGVVLWGAPPTYPSPATGGGRQIGEFLVMLTPLGYQLAHLRTKRMLSEGANSFVISGFRLLIGGTILLAVAWALIGLGAVRLEHPPLTPQVVALLVAYSLIVISAEKILWLEGIRRINLSKASGFLPLSVLASAAGAALVLHETLTWKHYAGGGLVIAGTYILSLVPSQKRSQ